MSQIIDRRLNGKNKSAVNRQKFIKRYKKQLKEAVRKAGSERSIKDIEKGEKVHIPSKDISEPKFGIGKGGIVDIVYPGNKEFNQGDLIPRPKEGNGSDGNNASDNGDSEDDFVFTLTKEEFMDLFFEDLELPNLIKTQLTQTNSYKWVRAGFSTNGTPANISVIRTMKGAIARRIATSSPYKRTLNELEEKLSHLLNNGKADDDNEVMLLREEIKRVKEKIKHIPYVDTFDIRYKNLKKENKPSTQAVMFCLMDVSGSMGEFEKNIAKHFFIILHLFLIRRYKKIELIFIRHHTSAKEVSEDEFFHSRETGGTVVSSALRLTRDIIKNRYPTNDWNIYVAQATDGDNWTDDSPICKELLINEIMPYLQYYAYIEIGKDEPYGNMWREYEKVSATFPNFSMEKINEVSEIYPVFRKLFEKRG